jgi:hypothetical protein
MVEAVDFLEHGNPANSLVVQGSGGFRQIIEAVYSKPVSILVSTAYQPFNPDGSPPAGIPRVVVQIKYGFAGAMVSMRTLAGTPKVVSGTHVYVLAGIFFDDLATKPAPPTINTLVTAIATPQQGQDVLPTRWARGTFGDGPPIPLVGAVKTLKLGQGRLKGAQGYNHSPNPTWLMLFDWPIPGSAADSVPTQSQNPLPGGIIPIPGAPASPGVDPYFSLDAITSKIEFTYGLTFSTSSTGDVYTPDNTGLVKCDAEFYDGEELA